MRKYILGCFEAQRFCLHFQSLGSYPGNNGPVFWETFDILLFENIHGFQLNLVGQPRLVLTHYLKVQYTVYRDKRCLNQVRIQAPLANFRNFSQNVGRKTCDFY